MKNAKTKPNPKKGDFILCLAMPSQQRRHLSVALCPPTQPQVLCSLLQFRPILGRKAKRSTLSSTRILTKLCVTVSCASAPRAMTERSSAHSECQERGKQLCRGRAGLGRDGLTRSLLRRAGVSPNEVGAAGTHPGFAAERVIVTAAVTQ